MEVFFHIGYPKTASTWLQEKLFPNLKKIQYIGNRETGRFFFESDAFLFNPEDVYQHLKCYTEASRYLFSSELLSTPINYGWHNGTISKTCADKIKITFPAAKILIFIRNQQSLAASAYQQYIKNGGTYSIKHFLYNSHFSCNHLLFDGLISYYDMLFGKENVYIFFFEDFVKNPRGFVESFCNLFGFEVDVDTLDFNIVNRGLRVGFIPLIRFLNLFHAKPVGRKRMVLKLPKFVGIINRLIKPLNQFRIFGNFAKYQNILDNKDIEYFRKTFAESNNKLARRVSYEKLKEHGYLL
ncbi:MAG: sulfotransferase [Tenuifilaceae bacterium]|jgi:hypothetical protein|nr:sulfotransferase [Bacteroidales bacterium]MDX9847376.1 sulfotransferase [Tenuifilaceae bacterium]